MPYVFSAVRRNGEAGLRAECLDCEWSETQWGPVTARSTLVTLAAEHEAACEQAPLVEGLLPAGQVGRVR